MSKITDLATALRKLLESGFYPVGARFPSEYELMERYNVARLTANKAVALLTAEGLLERGRRGSGTFVRCCKKFPQGWIAAFMDVASPYNAAMIAGAANTAMLNNYMLSIFNPRMPEITDALKKLEQSDCIGVLTGGYGILPSTLSKPVIYMDVEIDEETLTKIAEQTGGQYFRATDKQKLKAIYDEINELEKSKVEITDLTIYHERYLVFVLAAIALLLVEFLLEKIVLKRIP